jgi:hypothetical protein
MVEGETIMPIPGGDITSTETWGLVPPVTDEAITEAIVEADAQEVLEEYLPEEEIDPA